MGRARASHARRTPGRRRVILTRRVLSAGALIWIITGCKQIIGDLDRVIVLEIGNFERTVEVGDTLELTARALTAAGNEAPDAEIVWATLDVDSGPPILDLDPIGLAVGAFPGMQRVQARLDKLRSDPIPITVTAAPDSIAATGETRITVAAGDVESGPLSVILFENITDPGEPTPLGGKIVIFRLVDPAPASGPADGIEIVAGDTVATDDAQRAMVQTGSDGTASARVRITTARPDSVAIDVTTSTASGGAVAGSPVRFTVVFDPNP